MAQIRAQLAGDPDIWVKRHPRYLTAQAAVERAFGRVERLPQDDKPGGAKVRVLYRVHTAILKARDPS